MRLCLAAVLIVLAACTRSDPSGNKSDGGAGGFVWRGVIEGYYGPPWEDEDRLDLIGWFADHGLNIYIHAAKDDPYQRLSWRSPYPDEEMSRYAAEIALANSRGIAWVPSISPGFPLLEAAQPHDRDICFSCENDFDLLIGKLDQFWNLGARVLMLSFDDVIKVSTNPEDAAAYGTGNAAYGAMNADLLNRVYEHYSALDPRFALFTVPAEYSGDSDSAYLTAFRETLRPEVEVMWTGTGVYSSVVECAAAEGFGAAVGRKPVLWDNVTNDIAPYKLFVGPYAGRAANLPDCLRGIVINPAPQAQADKLSLGTAAIYFADPAGYDKELAWEETLRDFAGSPEQKAMLDPFIQNVRSTHMDRTESVLYGQLLGDFQAALETADWLPAHDRFMAEIGLEAATPERLRTSFHNPRVIAEFDTVLFLRSTERRATDSWLDQLALNAARSARATQALARTRPQLTAAREGTQICGAVAPPAGVPEVLQAQAAIAPSILAYTSNLLPVVNVHGDRFFFAISVPNVAENLVDRYMRETVTALGTYLLQAPLASGSVSLTLNGAEVPVGADGIWCAASTESAELLATDGAGNQTRLVVE